jgi:hypothetical protein
MAHFRGRQGKQREGQGGVTVSNRGNLGKRMGTDAGQEGLGQQHQRDVAIPAQVAAHFVVIQAQIFAVFKVFLDVPAFAKTK